MKREKIGERWDNLWLHATADWSYRANRYVLGSSSDPASWLEEPYTCVIIVFLLIYLVMLIDSYSCIVAWEWDSHRPLPEVFSPLFFPSMSHLFVAKENIWDQGTSMAVPFETLIDLFEIWWLLISINWISLTKEMNPITRERACQNKAGTRQYTRTVYYICWNSLYSPHFCIHFLLPPTLWLPPQFTDTLFGVSGISG